MTDPAWGTSPPPSSAEGWEAMCTWIHGRLGHALKELSEIDASPEMTSDLRDRCALLRVEIESLTTVVDSSRAVRP